jgi:hypothetical protein
MSIHDRTPLTCLIQKASITAPRQPTMPHKMNAPFPLELDLETLPMFTDDGSSDLSSISTAKRSGPWSPGQDETNSKVVSAINTLQWWDVAVQVGTRTATQFRQRWTGYLACNRNGVSPSRGRID